MIQLLRLLVSALALAVTFAASAEAQKPPKVDSILLILSQPKAAAMDQVLAAFMGAGLGVTDQTASLVTADAGSTKDGMFNVRHDRTARALLVSVDSTQTKILITGEEVRVDEKGGGQRQFRRQRIDNRAGGNGEKAWCRIVLAAMQLDSIQVDEPSRKRIACRNAGFR